MDQATTLDQPATNEPDLLPESLDLEEPSLENGGISSLPPPQPTQEQTTTCNNNLDIKSAPRVNTEDVPTNGAQSQLFNQNIKHVELIEKLKLQLKELERYAYQTGQLQCLPSSDLLERQTVIINQLKSKLSLNFDELDRLGPDDLKKKVDQELTELINPIIMKEHLVDQLKTQITDLERYIAFLHGVDDKIDIKNVCNCLMHGKFISINHIANKNIKDNCIHGNGSSSSAGNPDNIDQATSASSKIIKRILTILQVLTLAQFGCLNINVPPKNSQRPKTNPIHRATSEDIYPLQERLKFSIQEVINAAAAFNKPVSHQSQLPREPDSIDALDRTPNADLYDDDKKEVDAHSKETNSIVSNDDKKSDCNEKLELSPKLEENADSLVENIDKLDDNDDKYYKNNNCKLTTETPPDSIEPPVIESQRTNTVSQRFTTVVRKHLASSIKDLLNYGLVDDSNNVRSYFDPYYLLSSLTCLPGAKTSNQSKPHVWNVIETYYQSRSNTQFNVSSAKTLSQSFNLSSIGTLKMSSKQALLLAIEDIIIRLSKQKRGPDSHFKAFVCAGINQSKLAIWLRIIFKNKSIVKRYYHESSILHSADLFEAILKDIDRLSHIKCNLQIEGDLSQLENAF